MSIAYYMGGIIGSGIVAYGLSKVIFGDEDSSKKNIATVVIFLLCMAVMKTTVIPKLHAKADKAKLDTMPFIQAIKDKEPDTYNEFMALVDKAYAEGMTEQQVVSAARAKFQSVFESRISTSSDEAIEGFVLAFLPALKQLEAESADVCFKFLFPKPSDGSSVQTYLSKDVEDKMMAAMTEVIVSSNTEQASGSLDGLENELLTVFGTLAVKYEQKDLEALQNPHAPGVDKTKLCSITHDLYQEVLNLGKPKSTKVLRVMFSGM